MGANTPWLPLERICAQYGFGFFVREKSKFVASTAKRQRGLSRGNLSPLTVFWFLLYAQKERHGGEPYRLRLCKRPRPAARRPPAWSKISFTAFHGRKAGPAGRRILLCGEGRAQAGEGDLREVVAGLTGLAIQVHTVNGDLLPAGQGAKGGAALQVIQKG